MRIGKTNRGHSRRLEMLRQGKWRNIAILLEVPVNVKEMMLFEQRLEGGDHMDARSKSILLQKRTNAKALCYKIFSPPSFFGTG
jgi:hypothetical protein